MVIVAKAVKGKEFYYKPTSAHKVTSSNANKIVKALNDLNYNLTECETWHKYEVNEYCKAWIFAEKQRFILSKDGTLKRKYH